MKYFRLGIVVFLQYLMILPVQSQDVFYKQYTDADGLPSMTTYEMVQDSMGVLWIGTENGLVSYDGEEFKAYSHPDLKDNDIIELEISADGSLFFLNLSSQLMKIVDEEIIFIHQFTESNTHELVSSSKRDFVIQYGNSINRNNAIYEIIQNDSTTIKTLAYSANNYIFSNDAKTKTYARKAFRFKTTWKKGKRIEFYNNQNLYSIDSSALSNFINFYPDSISYNPRLYKIYHNSKIILVDRSSQMIEIDSVINEKFDIYNYSDFVIEDDLYFGISGNGLELYIASEEKYLNLISNIHVNTIFIDREKNIWVSTRENGLLKIPSIYVKLFRKESEEKDISKLHSYEDHLIIIQNDNVEIYNTRSKKSLFYDFKTEERAFMTYDRGKFYISSLNNHITYDPKTQILKKEKNHISTKCYEFRDSILFYGNSGALYHLDRETAFSEPERDKFNIIFRGNRVLVLKNCKQHKKFLCGTTLGLLQILQDKSAERYIDELSTYNISTIAEDGERSIWIGTKNNGLYKIVNDKIAGSFSIENGLLSNVIIDILIKGNYAYVATMKGVSRININTHHVVSKNEGNGLPSNTISSLCLLNDEILASVRNKIVVLDDAFFEYENVPPIISLGEVFKNNEKVSYEKNMKFKYDENKIDIILNNVSLTSVNNKFIKYRIPNLDTIWTTSRESVIRLPALKPGKYKVETIGINSVGAASEALNLSFEIKPPWWNTLWARILGVLLLLLIGNTIIRYRSKRIRKEESLKREYLGQINKIKDQALQLQMNPHFIFNSLNAIQGFIGTDEEEMAMNYLARFARLIRLIFEHSKGNTITLEEEFEFINLYLDLEKLRFKDKVNIHISVDDNVQSNKDIIKLPPLLIQPIVENSFKHGLFHKKGKGNLYIDYSIKEKVLQVIIKDDGIGRNQSQKINLKNSEKQISSGIKTTRERIEILNFGKKNKLNRIKIEDLYHDDGSPAGTQTILHLSI